MYNMQGFIVAETACKNAMQNKHHLLCVSSSAAFTSSLMFVHSMPSCRIVCIMLLFLHTNWCVGKEHPSIKPSVKEDVLKFEFEIEKNFAFMGDVLKF